MRHSKRHWNLPFSELTGRGVKVAVVDSGIDPAHPRIGKIAGGVDISIGPHGHIRFGSDFTDLAGHGTACAGIIRRKAPEAGIYSIRIFDESLVVHARPLVAAIRWAMGQGMDVVNISLGTTEFLDEVEEACREAVKRGIILIAAGHNEGLTSFPAAIPEVISVTGGKGFGRYEYFYREDIECVARGDEQRLCWLNQKEVMKGGTSFAAPHITGMVALIREAHPGATVDTVRGVLEANAIDEISDAEEKAPFAAVSKSTIPGDLLGFKREKRFDWIQRAALYPYNKEMHAFIRFRDLLDFEVVGVADPVGKGLVGKDAGEAIGTAPTGLKVEPNLGEAFRNANTLILGYVDRLGNIAKRDLLYDSIRAAMEQGLHVFSFLPVPSQVYPELYEIARKRKLKIAYPSISFGEVEDIVLNSRNGSDVDVPVLGVFGTSSRQGKFTLQLALRRRLIQGGYRVGQVGTEHHAELFGMDLSFPMGYASPLDLPLQYYVPYLDHMMKEINRQRRPDIVLVGSQSGTIPFDVSYPDTHILPSLAFLLGTRPDASILVVNGIDPDDYIRDTLDALCKIGKAPAILLAMSDQEKQVRKGYGKALVVSRQMSRDEIDRKLRYLEGTFKIPAVEIVSEEGQQKMLDLVIDHFSCRN